MAGAAKSGILPLAVIEESRTANLGLTYEQAPNDIRIQLSQAPTTQVLPDRATRFTGNFRTFMVSNERGELVTYRGAMIGKQVVIVADTESAKTLARKETQTVLAAAITTLGESQALALSQIESVILDLR